MLFGISPGQALGFSWMLWFFYWAYEGRKAKASLRRESLRSRFWFAASSVLIVALMGPGSWSVRPLAARLWEPTGISTGFGFVVLWGGLGFSIWARRSLGRNWSGRVGVQENHELIQSGPYRWIRHPIYTGMLTAALGSAIIVDQVSAFLAMPIAFLAFRRKWRLEERLMEETFGEAYRAYKEKSGAIVPKFRFFA